MVYMGDSLVSFLFEYMQSMLQWATSVKKQFDAKYKLPTQVGW